MRASCLYMCVDLWYHEVSVALGLQQVSHTACAPKTNADVRMSADASGRVLSDLQGRFVALGGATHALDRLVNDRRLQIPLRAALQLLCLLVDSGGVPEQRNT